MRSVMRITLSKALTSRKIEILADALKRFDIDKVYLVPALRELLKKDNMPGIE